MYYLSHHGSDGYPEGLGLKVLQYIRQPNAIATYQKVFGEMLDGLKSPSHSLLLIEGGDENFDGPSQLRPETCGWTYEIDLDRNIFHVCDMPFFSLECLPDDAVFLQYISDDGITRDHYGHAACPLECPPENRYKKPTPPIVHNSELETYQSLMCTGSQVALSDLLAVSDGLSQDEHVRVTLLEVMIGQCMFSSAIGKEIYEIELLNDHNQITDDQCAFAIPMLKRKEFTWVREDTVVYIATHLYDERCLQASVSRLINVILEQTNHSGHYFGIAFSVFHCAVVKVVKNAHTMSFSHTSALQFLPSFYADSPSTPGITALARLGYRIDPALFRRALEACHYVRYIHLKESLVQRADRSDDMPPTTICPTLPLELWREIACYLTHPFHLIVLGLVSRLCRQAVSMVLRCTHLCGYRLVSAPQERPEYRKENLSLRAASFSAVRNGIPTTVNVGVTGMLNDRLPEQRMIIPLEIKNSYFHLTLSADP
ncbi:uncharacterized protein F5891DRAFT_1190949 [Suillus fuscotomentosus]|uniref:F-box domain-containing protein n=1 Tax=Suillus fuscotomentosus TaxID=1912939 RepID=A0AAD4E2A3_9AGAM|nr:uncharacterized protein F5891DRAFT_1190949 [Suillus fuscotomentosus]KAG1898282.1 hypothetical protein F5891DRAFT_1190949 [Suillus fuscotomentosus]